MSKERSLKLITKEILIKFGFTTNPDSYSGVAIGDVSANKELTEFDFSGYLGNTSTINNFAFISNQKFAASVPNFDNTGLVKLTVNSSTTILSYHLTQCYVGIVCGNSLKVTANTYFYTPYGRFGTNSYNVADTFYYNENVNIQAKVPIIKVGFGGGWR